MVLRLLLLVCLYGLGHYDCVQAIASSESTNLAVVAPGIAEALLATAGLLAAIPAVIAYNKFNSDVGKAVAHGKALHILSRQIDERG